MWAQGAHGLWELSVNKAYHADLVEDLLEALVPQLACSDLQVSLLLHSLVQYVRFSVRKGVLESGWTLLSYQGMQGLWVLLMMLHGVLLGNHHSQILRLDTEYLICTPSSLRIAVVSFDLLPVMQHCVLLPKPCAMTWTLPVHCI